MPNEVGPVQSLVTLRSLSDLAHWRGKLDRPPVLVPTMGALHEGHGRLIEVAASLGGPVIVSIFVNPLQFGPTEDFGKYPRTLEADLALAVQAGADAVWLPTVEDLTPQGMIVSVDPGPMGDRLCGAWRPGHFRGVATIVMKLFQCVRPRASVFGWKDAQQMIILSKMVEDLNVGVEIIGVETVREPSGLAMSSRNRYLSPEMRDEAAAIGQALLEAKAYAISQGGVVVSSEICQRVRTGIERHPVLKKIQYVECVSTVDLAPLEKSVPGQTLLAVAVRLDQARLIDNVRW
jgi:pantoate--beta-alanine ligase